MARQRHVIKQQILDLILDARIGSNVRAIALQNWIAALFRSRIVPQIEDYCDRLSDPDTIVRIDTLEIDLGEINLDTLEADFVRKVAAALEEQLLKQQDLIKQKDVDAAIAIAPDRETHVSPGAKHRGRDRQQPQRTSALDANVELLQEFLQAGRLPWWCETLGRQDLEARFLELGDRAPARLRKLLQDCCKSEPVVRRVVYQFSEATLLEVFRLLAPRWLEIARSYLQDIEVFRPHVPAWRDISPQQLGQMVWEGLLLQVALEPTANPSAETVVRTHLLHLADRLSMEARSLRQQLLAAADSLANRGISLTSALSQILEKDRATLERSRRASQPNSTPQKPLLGGVGVAPETERQANQSRSANAIEANFELLQEFLQAERLPRWCEAIGQRDLEKCFSELADLAPERLQKLLRDCFQSEPVVRRAVERFSEATLLEMLRLLAPERTSEFSQILMSLLSSAEERGNSLPDANSDNSSDLRLRAPSEKAPIEKDMRSRPETDLETELTNRTNHLIRSLVTLTGSGGIPSTSPSVRSLVNQLIGQLDALEALAKSARRETARDWQSSIELNRSIASIRGTLSALDTQGATSGEFAAAPSLLQQTISEVKAFVREFFGESFGESFERSRPASSRPTWGAIASPRGDREDIYVQNSGLVLLSPFFERFFETLGLVESGAFLTPQATHRAILLLQYLVDASTETIESLLPLNKLLCGCDMEEPVPASLTMSDAERDEGDRLLAAVISHWSILKNTSNDGLRAAFLQRAGVLRPRSEDWLLQVESQTYDVLIERLPWSIRVVKLPWMRQILHVEW